MAYTDDPVADFYAHEEELEHEEEKLPICWHCEERIRDDYLYEIGGEILCEKCLNNAYRRYTEDFFE